MDDIFNLGEDITDFLDFPNSLCDDEILGDLDSLDFVNDFDDSLIYNCGNDKRFSNPDIYKASQESFFCQERNINHVNNVNNYGNFNSNGMTGLKNEVKENAEQKLMIIRELLDANVCVPQNGIITNLQNSGHQINKLSINNNRSTIETSKISNTRNITSKHPIILPANNVTSSNLLKTPTLAATLIGMQPSKVSSNNADSYSSMPSTGRGPRRNSHNAIEKRYRLSINDKIDELRHMLFLGDDSKMNKSNVLKKAIDRIKVLEDENNALRCENYNFRIARNLPIINNGNSIESLNHTGSSPSSNNSDSGRSIENSPSSSSMHSSSVTSGCLFLKSNETNCQKLPNSNRGVKRPLIYNSSNSTNDNTTSVLKTEKLARLLLDPKDNYVEKQSHSIDIQELHKSSKLHPSNVPGFLLCTLALFVVSFQPFDVILKQYQLKNSQITRGRHLLQYANSEEMDNMGYVFAMFLTLTHWCVAFVLVWGSTHNRFILKKSLSLLLYKIQIYLSSFTQKKSIHTYSTLIDLKNSLKDSSQDQRAFKSRLDNLIEEYGCSYRINPIKKLFQFAVCLMSILISLFRCKSQCKQNLSDTQKIRIYLLTVVIDQSFTDNSLYSRFELTWYKYLLYSLSWNAKVTSNILYSRFVLALSFSNGYIRKYLLKKAIGSVILQSDLVSDKLHLFLMNPEAQNLFIETNPQSLMEKFYLLSSDKRINSEKQGLLNCYFMVHAQETIEKASRIILNKGKDDTIADELKDIINCCSILLNDDESTFFSLWCCLHLVLLNCQDSCYLEKVATKLINHYNLLYKKSNIKDKKDSVRSTVAVLKLLISTLRLGGNEKDKICHEINIRCIQELLKNSNMNVVFQMLLKLSLNAIILALRSYNSSSASSVSKIIYYTNTYSKLLSKNYNPQSNIETEMVSEFEILLQKLCQLNPSRLILSNIEDSNSSKCVNNHNFKKIDDICYRITDFISFDRDSKLRSH